MLEGACRGGTECLLRLEKALLSPEKDGGSSVLPFYVCVTSPSLGGRYIQGRFASHSKFWGFGQKIAGFGAVGETPPDQEPRKEIEPATSSHTRPWARVIGLRIRPQPN
uniref:Uncharacterized protein n=1 Tax=Rhinopithecus bieti TaxID=61621 RepID=A0A2K6L102_RHIBE